MTRESLLLNVEKYRKLVRSAHDRSLRHGFTIDLLGHTGMRTREAAEFTEEWFNPDRGIIKISSEQRQRSPKTRSTREIQLPSDVSKRISYYLAELDDDVLNVSPRTIRRRTAQAGDAAEIPRVSPHIIRRTFGARLLEIGVPQKTVAEVLGVAVETVSMGQTSREFNADEFSPIYGELDLAADFDLQK